VVICLERGADLHMALLMPLPLTVSCSSKIQIGFTFLVSAHLGSPGRRAVKRVCGGVVTYLFVCSFVCLSALLAHYVQQALCNGRTSVRLSVCPIIHCCGFAAVRPSGRK